MRSRPTKDVAAPSSSPDSASAASPASGSPASAAVAASPFGVSACPDGAAVVVGGRKEDRGCGFLFWQQQREQRVPYGRVLQSILLHAENRHVLQQFLFFALLLAAVPISALLILPQVLQYLWGDPTEASAAGKADLQLRATAAARNWAAIAAVISVNLIALSYAYSAYKEEVSDWRLLSQQQQQRQGATAAAEGIAAEALPTGAIAAEAPAAAVEAAGAGAAAEGKKGKGDAGDEKKQKGL